MTIMCCWFNQSYSLDRLTGIADERAAVEEKRDVWKPLTETAVKLFRLTANCHALSCLYPEVGGWRKPYYHTEIGIGFAGYCFEALTIIALLSRVLDQLVADADDEPKPEPEGILNLAREITERYFAGHKNPDTQHVEFLIFGFSPRNGEPWVGKLVHNPKRPIELKFKQPVGPEDFFVIGDPQVKKTFQERVDAIRKRIAKRATDIEVGEGEDAQFDADRESGRLLAADRKAIENEVLAKIDDEFVHTVGGILQKIEVYRLDGDRGEVSYSRDDHPHLLDVLPCVGANLGYIPIGEKMGISQAFGRKGIFSGFESEDCSDGKPPRTFLD
jgi:hypothetical protein